MPGWIDHQAYDADPPDLSITVCTHEAINTGLLNADGRAILRAPNPLGFGRDDEWKAVSLSRHL